MRLKSHIFVSSLLRRAFALGGYAAVLRKGAEDAGAIFIRQRTRLGTETLFAPAPQNFFDDEVDLGRKFEVRLRDSEAERVDAALASEIRFDPDCWIVEIELDDRGDLFDVVSEDGAGQR
ncbi:DUF1491 family protein [Ensifer sp.]|jgi:hypothetical protein|uniref:DUF1491 family protein n=1 Tax=Ensifer sp. TaxID=1872086 RepID=UPI002E11DB2B|nr:DUF1491 family protein [Ensifer sp.]